jgi:hypothetical protein
LICVCGLLVDNAIMPRSFDQHAPTDQHGGGCRAAAGE